MGQPARAFQAENRPKAPKTGFSALKTQCALLWWGFGSSGQSCHPDGATVN